VMRWPHRFSSVEFKLIFSRSKCYGMEIPDAKERLSEEYDQVAQMYVFHAILPNCRY
jgi:hypothetical protein